MKRPARAVVAGWAIWMLSVWGYHFVFEHDGYEPFWYYGEFWRLLLVPPAIATGALALGRWALADD